MLNPTIVLRAGTQPVQRPNGGGAGFTDLVQDIVAGNNGGTNETINFSRAASVSSTSATLPAGINLDQIELATDQLPVIVANNSVDAVALSATQLSLVYAANTGSCLDLERPAHQRCGRRQHH